MFRKPRGLLLATFLLLTLPAALQASPDRARSGSANPGERFGQLDRNGDGSIDRSEAAAQPRPSERFDRIDRNRDGRLEKSELREARRLAQAQRDARQATLRLQRARFDWLDGNDDRALTLVEIGEEAPKLRERFVAMDTNRDGRLVAEEIQLHAKAQRQSRRGENANG